MRWRPLLPIVLLAALPVAAGATPLRLVLIGDSITAGQVTGPGDPFAVQLADRLGPAWEVANVACGGASSLDWAPSASGAFCGSLPDIQVPNLYGARARPALPADVVAILLGTNDALGFFEAEPVDPADYGAALASLASRLRLDGARHVLLLTPPPLFDDATADLLVQGYRDEVLALCDGPDPGIACGPDVYALLGPADFAVGNIHPRLSGHTRIADALYESVSALAPVPEPGPLPLAAAGLAVLSGRRRRMRRVPGP